MLGKSFSLIWHYRWLDTANNPDGTEIRSRLKQYSSNTCLHSRQYFVAARQIIPKRWAGNVWIIDTKETTETKTLCDKLISPPVRSSPFYGGSYKLFADACSVLGCWYFYRNERPKQSDRFDTALILQRCTALLWYRTWQLLQYNVKSAAVKTLSEWKQVHRTQ